MRWLRQHSRRYAADAHRRGSRVAHGLTDTSDLIPDGLDEERRFTYAPSWQMLEERVDADYDSGLGQGVGFEVDRFAQQVWGARSIDDAVLRRVDYHPSDGVFDNYDAVWYVTDHQFSVVAMLAKTGVVLGRTVYDAYGNERSFRPDDWDQDGDVDTDDFDAFYAAWSAQEPAADLDRDGDVDGSDLTAYLGTVPPSPAFESPVGYCGYLRSGQSGLWAVRFRHYDPRTGRWNQRDPAGYVDGMNLYEYVAGDPGGNGDSSGLELHVFVFEGLAGHNSDWDILEDTFNPQPEAKIYLLPIVNGSSEAKAHYYGQRDSQIRQALAKIEKLAKERYERDDEPGCWMHTFAAAGWSNGGHASIQFVSGARVNRRQGGGAFSGQRGEQIDFEFGFTVDPVPKGASLLLPPRIVMRKPRNADRWSSVYQREDIIKGHRVAGADNQRIPFGQGGRPHADIVSHPVTLQKFRDIIKQADRHRRAKK